MASAEVLSLMLLVLLPMPTEASMTHCRYRMSEEQRHSLFKDEHKRAIPFLIKSFLVEAGQPRCYLTRRDLTSTLQDISQDVTVMFGLHCLQSSASATEVLFLEETEQEDLAAGDVHQGNDRKPAPHHLVPDGVQAESLNVTQSPHHPVLDSVPTDDLNKTESNARAEEKDKASPGTHNPSVVSYVQSSNCRLSLKVVEAIASLTDLKVLTAMGHRAWDLKKDLEADPQLCKVFTSVKSLAILGDWTAPDSLHSLALCQGELDNVVEMTLTNDSLESFPEFLKDVVPNLGALEISNNLLTSPVEEFPWLTDPPAALPGNLSRTSWFNDAYSFGGSIHVPPHLFRRVLLLDGNNISSLTHFQFRGELQYISLKKNGLREIAEDVFHLVEDLQYLSLADNALEWLPEKLFSRLTQLRHLDLQGNRLTALPTHVFHNLRNLERLNAEDNRLETLQDGLFATLSGLRELRLKSNRVGAVAKAAFSRESVRLGLVDLQRNPLRTLPFALLEIPGLLTLNLDYTDIDALDFVEMSRQTSLRHLREALQNPTVATSRGLAGETYPSTPQRTVSLRHSQVAAVVVYNATRETLPIFRLVVAHVTFLLQGNPLRCDCRVLNATHQLAQWAGLHTATLSRFQDWTCSWPRELSGTTLINLQDHQTVCPLIQKDEAINGTGNTRCPLGCACYVRTTVGHVIVDCRDAGLASLPPRVPSNTRELWLQNNMIRSLDPRPYLPHLRVLYLSSNKLQHIAPAVLGSLGQLSELHLHDNLLTELRPDVSGLRHLHNLNALTLAGNPFRCNCNTRWMKRWIYQHERVDDASNVTCMTTSHVARGISQVPDFQFVCSETSPLRQDSAAPWLRAPSGPLLAVALSFTRLLVILV